MKYCKNCLDTDTRPNSIFNSQGICKACEYSITDQNNYNKLEKLEVLDTLIKKYKTNDNNFDCIIGISGGKDSTRQALWVRDKLKLKPLLVCCAYPPEQVTEVGAKNLSNLIDLGFDVIITSPSPRFWKKMLLEGFYQGNYLRGPELALFSSLPQIAIKYKIKLIFWGENPSKIWNDSKAKSLKEYDGNILRNSNTLKNCDYLWMKKLLKDKSKIIPYIYPSVEQFKKNNIQIVFLEWFWSDWSLTNNAKYSTLNGLFLREESSIKSGDLYGIMALDDIWVSINQMIKYYKFGIGRATDYCNFAIRDGQLSRAEAIKIVKKYDGRCDKDYINSFCSYTGISKKKFWNTISRFVNKKLFQKNKNNKFPIFKPIFKVGQNS